MASLEVVNRLLSKMVKGGVPLAIFIVLSKAFDTLDHDILVTNYNAMDFMKTYEI